MEFYKLGDVKEEALAEAKKTYAGFIKFLKWISLIWILLVMVMCSNNFLEDGTGAKYDPSWKEDYESNMGLDE